MRPPVPAAWSSPNLSRIPSSCPRAQFAQDAELSLRNCGAGRASNNEPTGRATGARPDDKLLDDGIRRGWRPGRVAGSISRRIPKEGPVGVPLADTSHLRQMNGATECLLDQIEGVDQDAHVDEPVRP